MKWIIYWVFYTSSLSPEETKNITGCIVITQDSISFYSAHVGYITMPIVASRSVISPDERRGIHKGTFVLKQGDLIVTIAIHSQYIIIHLHSGEYQERIYMKRKIPQI